MSPKKHILRELHLVGEAGSACAYVRPSDIPGYAAAPDRYQAAVNELLKERLIEGRSDGDGRMSIALNAQRIGDVRKALRPAWARPSVWVAAAIVAALGVGLAI
jgi:hypothetical protein